MRKTKFNKVLYFKEDQGMGRQLMSTFRTQMTYMYIIFNIHRIGKALRFISTKAMTDFQKSTNLSSEFNYNDFKYCKCVYTMTRHINSK